MIYNWGIVGIIVGFFLKGIQPPFQTKRLWLYEQVRSRNKVRGFHSLVFFVLLFFSNSSHVSGHKFFQFY